MQKNESSLPPPVPPRRKRSKIKPKQPPNASPRATNPECKPRVAPPLPPPAAPQRSKSGRKTPSPFPSENRPASAASSDYGHESSSETAKSSFEQAVPRKRRSKVQTLESEDQPKSNRSSSPFTKPPEPNQYPPLYFTFQDYQTVMEGSIESKDRPIKQQVINNVEENPDATVFPFLENIPFSNVREEIYFRVTTTSRPFEKCLGDWNRSYDNDVQEITEEQPTDLHIFEDYMDRSNRLNAKPELLFTEDFFSMGQDDNSVSTERSTTRVRFVVESPSTSTPDLDLDDDGTSYGEFVERQFENRVEPSLQLTEVTDEDLLYLDEDNSNDNEVQSELDLTNKLEPESGQDEDVSESLYGMTTNQIDDSYSDWEEDVDIYSLSACLQNRPKIDEEPTEKIDVSQLEEDTNDNMLLENNIIHSKTCPEELIIDDRIEEPREGRTIYIDSSFYNLADDDNNEWQSCSGENVKEENGKSKLNGNLQLAIPEIIEPPESCDEVNEIEEQEQASLQNDIENVTGTSSPDVAESAENIETNEVFLSDEKSVPESVRRNFFLETMLSDNNMSQNSLDEATVNCEVIAAHPKKDSRRASPERQCARPPDVVAATETKVAPRNSPMIKLTEPGSRPKAQTRINASPSNNKSAGEVKCDVLNELLTNFGAIKLRSVNTNARESVTVEDPDEQRMEEATKSIEEKTDEIRETEQVQTTVENRGDENTQADFNSDLPTMEKNSSSSSSSSSIIADKRDTCAIIKEAPYAQRIDNDNKAMTPVDVSKDQFHEAVSITPGSVRSFVKYYEIHSEISSIAKLKDNAFKKQKFELAREKDKTKDTKKSTKTGEKSKKTSKTSTTSKAEIPMEEREVISESSRVSMQHSPSSPTVLNQQQSCTKSLILSPKPERRKSVQFDNECTVISPRKNEKEKKAEEEGTLSSFIGGIKTKLKRKAPVKPDIKKSEQPKGLKLDQRRTESTAIICIQKSPEAKAVACTTKPGNRSFLPNTETLQSNQTIVFYCTV